MEVAAERADRQRQKEEEEGIRQIQSRQLKDQIRQNVDQTKKMFEDKVRRDVDNFKNEKQ